jgi:hypothetical protein
VPKNTFKINLERTQIIVRRRLLTSTLSLLSCVNHLTQHLIDVTLFRLLKSLYSPSFVFKRTNNFGSLLPNSLECRIYENKFRTRHLSFFPFFICCITFNFSFNAQNIPFICDCSCVIIIQSPANFRSRNIKEDIMHKVNCHYYCHSPSLKVYLL